MKEGKKLIPAIVNRKPAQMANESECIKTNKHTHELKIAHRREKKKIKRNLKKSRVI